MKKILLSIFFFLAAIFIAAQADADYYYYVNNPANCPSSYLSQTCVSPTKVCGVSQSDTVQCYNTAEIQPRSSSSSVESGTATTSGGYYINCTAPMDNDREPYCDNYGQFWCLQKSSCDSAKLKTICTGGAWASATCGACKTGYHDCNNDGDCSDGDEHDGVSCDDGLGYWNNCNCVRSILKLGPDSVSSNGAIIQSAANPLMYIGSGVSIGTSTMETSTLKVWGASRFFNPVTVDTAVDGGHAVNKDYLDSVVFATGGAFWILNGSNLYASSTDWNVGIGTTSPNAKLDVNGSLAVRGTVSFTGPLYINEGNRLLMVDNDGNVSATSTQAGVSMPSGSAGQTLRYGSSGWEATSSIYVANDGKVGIRTTNPTANLQVVHSNANYGMIIDANNFDLAYAPFAVNNIKPSSNLNYGKVFQFMQYGENFVRGVLYGDGSYGIGPGNATRDIFLSRSAANTFKISSDRLNGAGNLVVTGNVGIGTTSPAASLAVNGNAIANPPTDSSHLATRGYVDSVAFAAGSALWILSDSNLYASSTDWNVGIGTTSPNAKLDVNGSLAVRGTVSFTGPLYINEGNRLLMVDNDGNVSATSTFLGSNYVVKTGDIMTGALGFSSSTPPYDAINLNGNNIIAVNKLGVVTIDPVYNIRGTKYSSYAPSVVGGVKEEYIGRGSIKDCNHDVCSWVLDFGQVTEGSDLWVWRQVVDFRPETIDVFMTAYGRPALLSYEIGDNQIIFYADRPTQFSYRLVGSRFDWRQWPTLAADQSEPTSLVVP